MADKITVAQFGQKIKTQFPQYGSVDDFTLGSKMLEKYPVYKDMVKYDPRLDTEVSKMIEEGKR